MAKPNIPNQKKAYNDLRLRIDKYTLLIEDIYNTYNLEASKIALSTPFSEGVFRFSDFPLTKDKVGKMLEKWREDMIGAIKATTSQEWKKSNEFQDLLADGAMKYYYGSTKGKRKRKYYQTNSDAYQAFIERKDKGMNLSKKIWVQSQDYKEELEAAISTGIQKGMSAVTLSKKVSKYLIDYPLLQKEYKEKFGKATTAKNCEYKSIRLARSEINIAYREAEQKRWSQFDFVVGKEIKISKVHFHRMPMGDLCDELQGKYPKDFPWNGWHPNCFCYEIPILKDEDEFFELEENEAGKNAVKDVPNVFVDWVDRNKDRILRAEERNTLPYFIRDNYNTVKGIITPNPVLSTLEKAKLRHAARTKEQIQEIQDRWDERKKEYRIANNMANNILSISNEYPEVSVENLKKYIDNYDISSMREEARRVAKQIVDIRKDERMLEVLIPNVHEWKKQFTSAELHEVYDAVEKGLSKIDAEPLNVLKYNTILEQKKSLLEKEIKYVADPDYLKPHKLYPTWEVSQAAYTKRLEKVIDEIEWENINTELVSITSFKTKSKPYHDLVSNLQNAISTKDKAKAQSIIADIQTKREALKRAADARAKKKAISTAVFDDDCFSQDRKDAAVWHKTARKADDYFHDNAVEFWQKLTDEEKEALWGYTAGSGYITEPLRAINGHYYYYEYRMAETERHIRAMTSALNKQTLKDDVWIKRDSDPWNIDYIFGIELDKYRSNPSALVGKSGLEDSFQSCGSCKETRFTCTGPKKVIMNIYCPKGTNGAYAQPWSSCGTYGRSWNGTDKANPNKHSENEVLLQRGAKMRITKAEYTNEMWYIDVDVIGFDIRDFDLEKGAGGYFCKFK